MADYASMWEIMKKYQFHVESELLNDVVCIICKKILIDAHQGPCGCNFCKLCIENYVRNNNELCPGNAKECKQVRLSLEKNIVKDNGANRKISKIKVKCPFLSCKHTCEIIELTDHLKNCIYQSICPYSNIGCTLLVKSNESMSNHLENCIYEHNKMVVNWLDKFKNETTNQMQKLMANKPMDFVENECGGNYNEISNLKAICKRLEDENSVLKVDIKSLKNAIGNAKQISGKRDSIVSNISEVSRLFSKRGSVISQSNLSDDIIENLIGRIKWDIGKQYQRKVSNEHIFSEYFYSIDKIYEMRLRYYPTGTCCNDGDTLSVKFYIHKVSKDVKIFYPFKGNISVSIINKMQPGARKMKTKYREINDASLSHDNTETFHFSISELRQLRVLDNDCLTIECIVIAEDLDHL